MGRDGAVLGTGWRLRVFPRETPPHASYAWNATAFMSTAARLAESPEWSETAVSAQEDRASGAAATTPPVNQ
jgi:hypothetical protein